MFVFKRDYTFTWKVGVLVPTETGQEERSCVVLFRLVDRDELDAAVNAAAGKGDETVVRMTVAGFQTMTDDLTDAGKPIAFSPEAVDAICKLPFLTFALARDYYTAVGGVLRQKN